MLDHKQLEDLVIQPCLDDLKAYSKDAVELLKFTCAAESDGGTYIKQINGCAYGIYQMEPATYTDIWINYILTRHRLIAIMSLSFDNPSPSKFGQILYDMRLATAMARIMYMRFPEALPKHDDIDGMWLYYKKYWNTSKGKATKEKAIKAYKSFCKIK